MPTTTLMNRVPAKGLEKAPTMDETTTNTKPQLLAKEVFRPQLANFKRERIIPLYKDTTWSAELIDRSSLSKYNNNY